jgi:uncharacterized protein
MTARRRRVRPPKRAMSLEQLNTWLNTLEPASKVDGTSMLDGYLTAIVIGPRSIPPDEWFVDLLGEHGHIATASGATLAAIMAIVGRFNAISEGLSSVPNQHAPIFEKTMTARCCRIHGAWGSWPRCGCASRHGGRCVI